MRRKAELTGQRFGRLVVIQENGRAKKGDVLWLCQCDCGKTANVTSNRLTKGNTTSCGCYHTERQREPKKHGHKTGGEHTQAYVAWINMRQRCSNSKKVDWENYGGRGITFCDWWEDFENFLEDMGQPAEGESLDRIDVNGNYEPGNCRWATRAVQNRNRRDNHIIEFRGKSQTLTDWSAELGIPYDTVRARFRRGWDAEKAFTTPVRPQKPRE